MAEQFIRMLHHVGMPKTDLDYIQGNGKVVGEILKQGHPRSTLFTGSQKVAEQLAVDLKGKVHTVPSLHKNLRLVKPGSELGADCTSSFSFRMWKADWTSHVMYSCQAGSSLCHCEAFKLHPDAAGLPGRCWLRLEDSGAGCDRL